MDLQKLTFPLMVAAAVIGLWVVLRPKPAASTANQPNPAPSGLPNYTPAAETYQVQPPQLAQPSLPVVLADPYNPYPGQQAPKTPPAYLSFNYGPGHDLSKVPLTPDQLAQMGGDRSTGGACGCGGMNYSDCSSDVNHGVFPDGRGGLMAKNGLELVRRLGRQDPGWLNRAAYNLAGSDVIPQATAPIQKFTSDSNDVKTGVPGAVSQPAAPTSTFTPATPGADVVNRPAIPKSNLVAQWNGNAVVNTVGSVDTRVTEVGTNLLTYGHQVPALSAKLLNHLVQLPMSGE